MFSRREALSYLTASLYDDPDQRIEALDLAEDLRCLPLALAQAAALMADRGLDCRSYRAWFAERKRRLPGSVAGSYSSIATVTWSLSLDYADQLPPAGLARPALAMTALLDPNGVPGAVLTSKPGCEFIAGRPGDAAAADGQQARGALQNLARLGLVTIDPASAERTVRVHPMVQATVREALPPAVLKQAAQAAAEALLETWPARDTQPVLAQTLRDNTASLRRCTGDLLLAPESIPLLFRAGRSLEDAGLTGPAISYWQLMTDAIDRVHGPAHARALAARDHLAAAYDAAGRPGEAIGARRSCLEERERILGPDHPDTLASRSDLADAHLAAGRLTEAIALYERTLAGREWALGPEHPDTLTSRGNLAFAYSSAGRPADAIAIFQRTLADRERILGPEHPDTLTARGNLAAAYHTARRLKDAIPLYERILADRELVQGPDHPDTVTARGNLAAAYHSAGRIVDAVPLYERTLADCERIRGPHHQDTLTSRCNLAHAYHTARRQADAIAVFERTLADCESALDPGHPLTQTVRESLEAATQA